MTELIRGFDRAEAAYEARMPPEPREDGPDLPDEDALSRMGYVVFDEGTGWTWGLGDEIYGDSYESADAAWNAATEHWRGSARLVRPMWRPGRLPGLRRHLMTTTANGTPMTDVATTEAPKPQVELNGRMTGLDQAWRMSQALAQSALLPNALRNKPSDVLVTILYGQEIGLTPMQAIQAIYVVNGRPTMSGQLWLAKVRQAGHRVELNADEKKATCTITRGDTGETHSETFTMEQAKAAKLDKKDVWVAYPKRMLGWRAVSHCATVACPEVALGFELTEAVLDEQQAAKPTLAEVAGQRVDTATGEVHDAEVVDDEAIRAQVEQLQTKHTAEPTDEDIAAMAAEMTPDVDDAPPSGLFGDGS